MNFTVASGSAPGGIDLLVSGVISGFNNTYTPGITKLGSGMMVMTGANSYGGATTVSGGTLQFGDGVSNNGAIGGGNITDNTTLVWNNPTTYSSPSISVLSGSGALVKAGAGFLWLNDTGTVSLGSVLVSSGTLRLTNGITVSPTISAVSVASGATLDMWAVPWSINTLSGSGTITSGWYNLPNITLTVGGSGGSSEFDGTINAGYNSGGNVETINLAKSGSGLFTLGGANSYSGVTTISGGTLQVGGSGVLGGGSYSNTIANSGAFVMNTSSAQTLAGIISGSGALYQNGSGVTTLTAANSYSGSTTIGGGTLALGGAGVLGGGNYTNTIANSGALYFNSSSNQTFSGAISGTGGLYQANSGILTLAASNFYTGPTVVNGASGNSYAGNTNLYLNSSTGTAISGNLTIGGAYGGVVRALAPNQFGPNSVLTFTPVSNSSTGQGYFILTGNNQTIAGLQSTGAAAVDANIENAENVSAPSSGTLTINTSGNYTYSGLIRDNYQQNGTISIVKSGTGMETLNGNNAYTGGTTVSGGTLQIGGSYSGGPNFVDNATLVLGFGAVLSGGTISGTGTLIKNGGGDLWLGNNGVKQYIQLGQGSLIDVQAGTLRNNWGNGVWTSNSAAMEIDSGATFYMWDAATNIDFLTGSGTLTKGQNNAHTLTVGVAGGSGTFSGNINQDTGTISLTKQGAGVQVLSGANNYTGATTISGGTLQIGNGGSTGSLSPSSVITDNAALAFNLSNASTFSNTINGSGNLFQLGTGTTTITGAVSYSGSTIVTNGSLVLPNYPYNANGGTPVAGSAVNIASGAALTVNYANGDSKSMTLLTGGGTMNFQGSGTYYPIYAGGTTQVISMNPGGLWHVATGVCALGYGYAANFENNRGSMLLDPGATFNCWDFGSSTYHNLNLDTLLGSGTLTKTGYSGTVNVVLGVAGGSGTFNGVITNASGTLNVSKTGAGVATLAGTDSYNGTTTINQGGLVYSVSSALAGNVTIAGGALGTGYQSAAAWLSSGRINSNPSGTLALTSSDSSNPVFTSSYANLYLGSIGNNTFTGTITPAGNTYRLGGGGGTITLPNALALTDSGVRRRAWWWAGTSCSAAATLTAAAPRSTAARSRPPTPPPSAPPPAI